MLPASPPVRALLWRALWQTVLAGTLLGGVYGTLVMLLLFLFEDPLGQLLWGTLIGGFYGLLLGVLAGLTLGTVLTVAWRSGVPDLRRARFLGVLAGLPLALVAALLLVALLGIDPRTPSLNATDVELLALLLAVPALLMLGWMGFEAGALARWSQLRASGATPTPPLPVREDDDGA